VAAQEGAPGTVYRCDVAYWCSVGYPPAIYTTASCHSIIGTSTMGTTIMTCLGGLGGPASPHHHIAVSHRPLQPLTLLAQLAALVLGVPDLLDAPPPEAPELGDLGNGLGDEVQPVGSVERRDARTGLESR
jgi:hypothetical protein